MELDTLSSQSVHLTTFWFASATLRERVNAIKFCVTFHGRRPIYTSGDLFSFFSLHSYIYIELEVVVWDKATFP